MRSRITNSRLCQFNYLLLISLVLSAFTFLWHPLDYPTIGYTDGTTMRRAMHFIMGQGVQDPYYSYDHPFFPQIFLGGLLWILNYPDSVHPAAQGDVFSSTERLWLVPKILFGIMAIADTFFIYKISERRYDKRVAFIAAILFAIFPIQFLRTMYFESIQLPFILASILFALYSGGNTIKNKPRMIYILFSGILLGLAIFTKIPAFTIMPMVGFLIFRNAKSLRHITLWLIPVLLIPLLWPGYALVSGEFDQWVDGVIWQTHRQEASLNFIQIASNNTLPQAITDDAIKMPVLFLLGFAGLVISVIRKDFFLLLWATPFLLFLYFIGFVRDFHLMPIFPVLCISAASFIVTLSRKIPYKRAQEILPFIVISSIAAVGIVNISYTYVGSNNNDSFAISALVTRYLQDNRNVNITIISSNDHSWIPRYIFQTGNEYLIPELYVEEVPKNHKVLIVVNHSVRLILNGEDAVGEHFRSIYEQNAPTGTAIAQIGKDKVVLPQKWPSVLEPSSSKNIIDENHKWNSHGNVTIEKSIDNLTGIMTTKKLNSRSEDTYMHTTSTLKNLTNSPLLLYLEFVSKSSLSDNKTKYYVEIVDSMESNKIYFKNNLRNTSGKLGHSLFLLPNELADKNIVLRFGVNPESEGEHVLTLKKAYITSQIPN